MPTLHTAAPALVLSAALLVAGCGDTATAPSHEQAHTVAAPATMSDARLSDLQKDVRRVTSRFHSTRQAEAAGYTPAEHCVASPLGGMGMHWVNMNLVDPVFDPLHPEVMLYEPGPNGRPKLVGVEYIVIDVGQPRPAFDGHAFDVGGTPVPVAHWSLHVWVHRDNPSGVFAPFNPRVSCS